MGLFDIHRPLPGDAVAGAQLAEQALGVQEGLGGLGLLGGGLAAALDEGLDFVHQAGLLRSGGLLLRRRVQGGVVHPLLLYREAAQIGQPLGGVVVLVPDNGVVGQAGLKLERGGSGDGQAVRPLHPLVPGDVYQVQEDGVAVVSHQLQVQRDLIDHLVGHQHLTVTVQNLPPGGGDRLVLGDFLLGLRVVFVAVVDLEVIQRGPHAGDHQGQKQYHGPHPAVKLLGIHLGLLFQTRRKHTA